MSMVDLVIADLKFERHLAMLASTKARTKAHKEASTTPRKASEKEES